VPEEKHAELAKVLLDDGTPEGTTAYEDCVRKAHGTRWDVRGVPVDMSRRAVAAMLAHKAKWSAIEVSYSRMAKRRGQKNWRILASPGLDPPEQLAHRGSMILIRKAPPPKKRNVPVERRPKKTSPGQQGKAEKPQEPKWPKQYQLDREKGPSWASKRIPRTYAEAAKGGKPEEEVMEDEDFEEAEEEEEPAPPSPDKAGGSKGGGKVKPKPRGTAAQQPLPQAAAAGPEVSPLVAQLEALLPTLLKMAAAFADQGAAGPSMSGAPAGSTSPEEVGGFGPAIAKTGTGGLAAVRAGAAPY